MGKIPEYTRNKFTSSYVGGSQVDRSGEIITKGLGAAIDTVSAVAISKIEKQNQVIIDQQANKAVLEYSLAYQKEAKELEKRYADNPDAYPEAVTNMGMKLQATYSDKIPDERVRARFGGAANLVIKQSQTSAFDRVADKKRANGYIAWQDSMGTAVATAAEQTTKEGLTDTLGSIAEIAESFEFATPDERLVARNKMVKEGTTAYMYAQMDDNPKAFWNELDQGNYDDLSYTYAGKKYKVPVSTAIKREFKGLSKKRAITNRETKQLERALRVSGELQELATKVDTGEATLQDLLYKRDQIYAQGTVADEQGDREPPASSEEKANVDSLIKLEVSTLAKSGKTDPYVLDDLNTTWLALSEKIEENADDPQKMTTELLKYSTAVNNAFDTGRISSTDFTRINRKLSTPLMQSIYEQNGQQKGLFRKRYQDPLGANYKSMRAAVDNMTINDDQKLRTRTKAFSFFLDQVAGAEEQGRVLKEEDYAAMSTQALRKAQGIYFSGVGEPDEKIVTVNGVTLRYTGLNANGVADYQPDGPTQTSAKMKR